MSDDIIYPRCIRGGRDPAFTVRGFFLPCCWCDNQASYDEFDYLGFFHEDLHIDSLKNVDDIRGVFQSDEWLHFYDILENKQREAPKTCKQHCGISNGKVRSKTDKINEEGRILGSYELINIKEL